MVNGKLKLEVLVTAGILLEELVVVVVLNEGEEPVLPI